MPKKKRQMNQKGGHELFFTCHPAILLFVLSRDFKQLWTANRSGDAHDEAEGWWMHGFCMTFPRYFLQCISDFSLDVERFWMGRRLIFNWQNAIAQATTRSAAVCDIRLLWIASSSHPVEHYGVFLVLQLSELNSKVFMDFCNTLHCKPDTAYTNYAKCFRVSGEGGNTHASKQEKQIYWISSVFSFWTVVLGGLVHSFNIGAWVPSAHCTEICNAFQSGLGASQLVKATSHQSPFVAQVPMHPLLIMSSQLILETHTLVLFSCLYPSIL